MTELITIKDMPRELKIFLLKELDYSSDGIFVLDSNEKKLLDRYTNTSIKIDNMIIFPGSTIILENSPISISSFLEEFGHVI